MTAPAALASESVQRLSAQSTEGAHNLVQSVDWMAIAPPRSPPSSPWSSW